MGGAAAHAQPDLEPRLEVGGLRRPAESLYRAIFVTNVETGETRQITDGLADAMYPVWDASGKYLWFLASTDFGLRSQWLDMTSYDRQENFGLYLAVLKKGEASPLLPESDEDTGVSQPGAPGGGRSSGGSGTPPPGGGRGGGEAAAGGGETGGAQEPAQPARAPRAPVTVTDRFRRTRRSGSSPFRACPNGSTAS